MLDNYKALGAWTTAFFTFFIVYDAAYTLIYLLDGHFLMGGFFLALTVFMVWATNRAGLRTREANRINDESEARLRKVYDDLGLEYPAHWKDNVR